MSNPDKDAPGDAPAVHRRFYKDAVAAPAAGGYGVLIDGRQLRTPGKTPFVAPTSALAEACAAEWRAQGDAVQPQTMPLTRLVNVALDHTPRARARIVESIAGYAATDLVCHRADAPEPLAAKQAEAWDPLVAWAAERLRAPLAVVTGVIAARQPDAARPAFAASAEAFDDFALTGLARAVGMAGSGVIGLAMAHGHLDAEAAWRAACVDDFWQLETWGEDFIARQRLDALKEEFDTLGAWFSALR
ncbi:MAG: ATP12 family protein [Hyphomonadaceae bacterium]|nr:ATP12 family protein [Hyphomonadaceae bacterium]